MRFAIVAGLLVLPLPALAQVSSPSAPSISPSAPATRGTAPAPTPTVPAPAPLAPNVSPTQAAPVDTAPRVRPDTSPTQAAPVPSPVQTPGQTPGTGPQRATTPAAGGRPNRNEATQPADEGERQRDRDLREARLRASDERIRRLIRDICIGCENPVPRATRTAVVRAKG